MLEPRLKPETKINIREVESALSIVRDQVATIYLNQAIWGNELGLFGEFITSYQLEVKRDSERGVTYVELPVRVLDVAKKYGVYQVFSRKDMANLFIPVSNSFNFMYGGSEASSLEGMNGYLFEGNKLIFTVDQEEGQSVQGNLVVVSDDLDSFDEFPVAASIVPDIIKGTLELMSIEKQIPEDIINDEIDQP
jgi:hypothetical protein